MEKQYMQDATKLLLDRIISWEKDLSEYPSLESILREQFVIFERPDDQLDSAILEGTSTTEQDREYLISEGVDPDEIVEKGLVFVKTAMELGSVKFELSELKKDRDELVAALNKFLNYSSSNDRIVEVHEFALQVLSRIKI